MGGVAFAYCVFVVLCCSDDNNVEDPTSLKAVLAALTKAQTGKGVKRTRITVSLITFFLFIFFYFFFILFIFFFFEGISLITNLKVQCYCFVSQNIILN